MRRTIALAVIGLMAMGAGLDAQGRPGAATPERRQQLEMQLRRGLWRVAKQRVGFTDEQMTRLESTTQRFDTRRRSLADDERTQRQILRREVLADSSANDAALGAALDRVYLLQRQRADLLIEEQREFAAFMTPVQRAKFMALQEQLRRRAETLREARPAGAMGRRAPGGGAG